MSFSIEATYENGVLKPTNPLPLPEHTKVRLTVQEAAPERKPTVEEALSAVRRSAGLIRWTGDPELLRRIAEDDEFGIMESR
jgi:predicted DNA-binding antitoxin AbrB/MazE fold protein